MDIKQAIQLARESSIDLLDCQLLLCHLLKRNRAWLIAHDDYQLSKDNAKAFHELISHLIKGTPLAYITGEKEFWGRTFNVSSNTLIPRPETELIIDLTLKLPTTPKNIIDMGTGSGIIAITLAKELPQSTVWATDKSHKALNIAKHNAKNIKVKNIHFMLSNWYQNLSNLNFDLIISNPPYISADDPHLRHLSSEPKTALVAENNGFSDIEHIIKNAPKHLNHQAWLMIEHGYMQKEMVQLAFKKEQFTNIKTAHDLAGHPRVTYGQNIK